MHPVVFFAFRDNPLCFVHVLLNSLDMSKKGMGGQIVLEGEAVTLVPILADPGHVLHALYRQIREQGLILGACRACSRKLKVTELIEQEGIPLIGEMADHPAMSAFLADGYTVLTF